MSILNSSNINNVSVSLNPPNKTLDQCQSQKCFQIYLLFTVTGPVYV